MSNQHTQQFPPLVGSRLAVHSRFEQGDDPVEAPTCTTAIQSHAVLRSLSALVLVVCGVLALTASSAVAANFTWSGAEPRPIGPPDGIWSNGENWAGGVAPSGTVGTLTFPVLTSPACTGSRPTDVCYESSNNLSGLNVNAVLIENHTTEVVPGGFGGLYAISGNAFTLGSGGLTESDPSSLFYGGATSLDTPITLGASQAWLLNGNEHGGGIEVRGGLTGEAAALQVDLSNVGRFIDAKDIEVGAITVKGGNPSKTGSAAYENGAVSLGGFSAEEKGFLNATDGKPVHVIDASIYGYGTVGALTTTGGYLTVYPYGGGLNVAGAATFDPASLVELYFNGGGEHSLLSATGAANLGSAQLRLSGSGNVEGTCPTVKPGETDTLITTTGLLEGTFSGVPSGGTLPVECFPGEGGTPPTVSINYTAHTVTATVETAAKSAKEMEEEAAAKKKAEEEAAVKKHQEEATAKKHQEEEAAAKKKQEQAPAPILGQRQTLTLLSGKVTIHVKGTSTLFPCQARARFLMAAKLTPPTAGS